MSDEQLARIEAMWREGYELRDDVAISPDWLEDLTAEVRRLRAEVERLSSLVPVDYTGDQF